MDLRALTDPEAAASSGVPHGDALLAFAEAVVTGGPGMSGASHDDPILAEARQRLLDAVGPEGLVDAAASVAHFQRMDRIADATGVPLDAPLDLMTADLRAELGIDRYAAAADTRRAGSIKRALGGLVRRAAVGVMKLLGAGRRHTNG